MPIDSTLFTTQGGVEFDAAVRGAAEMSIFAPITRVQPSENKTITFSGLLDIAPASQEDGPPQVYSLDEATISATTVRWSTAIGVSTDDLETGVLSSELRASIAKLGEEVENAKYNNLVGTILSGLESATGYDGVTYYSASHVVGDSTASNDETLDTASTTIVTPAEGIALVEQVQNTMSGMRSNTGRYMKDAERLLIVTNVANGRILKQVTGPNGALYVGGSGAMSPLMGEGHVIVGDPRITAGKFYSFNLSEMGGLEPLLLGEYRGVRLGENPEDVLTRSKVFMADNYFVWVGGNFRKSHCTTLE